MSAKCWPSLELILFGMGSFDGSILGRHIHEFGGNLITLCIHMNLCPFFIFPHVYPWRMKSKVSANTVGSIFLAMLSSLFVGKSVPRILQSLCMWNTGEVVLYMMETMVCICIRILLVMDYIEAHTSLITYSHLVVCKTLNVSWLNLATNSC